jgi:hypothetical protein
VYYSTKVELSTYMTPAEDIARTIADQDEGARRLLSRHHNFLTPLLRLPEEILCHLFQVIQESRVPAVLNKLIHMSWSILSCTEYTRFMDLPRLTMERRLAIYRGSTNANATIVRVLACV